MDLKKIRISYPDAVLSEKQMASTPLAQFNIWFNEILSSSSPYIIEPNAMVLATCNERHEVTTRSVLLKGIDFRGLTFYTNYESRKAKAMRENKNISVTFPWYQIHRQVTVVGWVSKLSAAESEEYFYSRPHESQLGALVSTQSKIIESRDDLENSMRSMVRKYPKGSKIPMPTNWGGYLITVDSMEFWQGRKSRLHDRLRYIKSGTNSDLSDPKAWQIIRVSP